MLRVGRGSFCRYRLLLLRKGRLLPAAGIAAVVPWIALSGISSADAQQATAVPAAETLPSFEVAAIKPTKPDDHDHNWSSNSDRLRIEGYTLRDLITSAYGLKSNRQTLAGPDWLDKKHFDIVGKVDDTQVAKMKAMPLTDRSKAWQLMLRSLLADRFHLKVRQDEQELPVIALVVAGSAAKLTQTSPAGKEHSSLSSSNGDLTAKGVSMESFAEFLGRLPDSGDRVVIDQTGLAGGFDFNLNWSWQEGDGVSPNDKYPGLFTALQEQLGLKLKPAKAPVKVVIVEAATEPAYD